MSKPGKTIRIFCSTPDLRCPNCGARLNAHSALDDGPPPQPGDLTVCQTCMKPCKFDALMTLVKMTPREILEVCMTLPDNSPARQMLENRWTGWKT